VVAHLSYVRVEAWLAGAVAHLAGELGEVLGLELAAVDPLQPPLAAYFAQVGGHRVVVDLRPGNQENRGFHAPHGTAHYSGSGSRTRTTQVEDIADDLVPGPARGGQDRLRVELHGPPGRGGVLDRHPHAVRGGGGHGGPAADLAG